MAVVVVVVVFIDWFILLSGDWEIFSYCLVLDSSLRFYEVFQDILKVFLSFYEN